MATDRASVDASDFRNPAEVGEHARLAKAWAHEFLHIAMMSALVTMSCNAIAAIGTAAGMAAIEGNIPDEPTVNRAIRDGLLELPEEFWSLQTTTQNAYDALRAAVTEFRHVQSAPVDRVTRRAVESLADHWRDTSELLLLALEHFGAKRLLPINTVTVYSIEGRCPGRIRQLLLDAIAGHELDGVRISYGAGGEPPMLVQRRRWDRKNVNLACQADVKGQTHAVTLRNVSLGGALLDGMPFLMRGTPLRVTLSPERSLDATVMWARDGATGIKFDKQLMYDDPLIEETVTT